MAKHSPFHRNQVRIIAGTHRSRMIHFPAVDGLRPTADMVREKIFNWLGQTFYGKTVLDLFSGSGVLGFEAASRGAQKVVMIEKNHQIYTALKQNVLNLNQISIQKDDAFHFLANNSIKFDCVFLDPPYAFHQWDILWQALEPHLNQDAMIYVESDRILDIPENGSLHKTGKSGISHFAVWIYKKSTAE